MTLILASMAVVVAMNAASPEAASVPAEPRSPTEQAKIQAMLEMVGRSQVTFVRNGVEHTAAQARKHLEGKLRAAGWRVRTARDFIDRVASRSSISNRPYAVRLPRGKEVPAREWFLDRLSEVEAEKQ